MEHRIILCHLPEFVRWLDDENSDIQDAANEVLSDVDLTRLAGHIADQVARQHRDACALDLAKVSKAFLPLLITLRRLVLDQAVLSEDACSAVWQELGSGTMSAAAASLRRASVQVLGGVMYLEPRELATQVPRLLPWLDDGSSDVRVAATRCFGRLPPEVICKHADIVERQLHDSSGFARLAAIEAIIQLYPADAAVHAMSLIQRLDDEATAVGLAALKALSRLEPSELQKHEAAVSQKLGNGYTLLHLACEHGYVQAVQMLGTRHRRFMLHRATDKQETALHIASRKGYVEICQILVRLGALLQVKNISRQTPIELARSLKKNMVVNFLKAKEKGHAVQGGSGNIFSLAMSDSRPVTGVEWYTRKLGGVIGAMGAIHSFLVVTVGSRDVCEQNFDMYVIEKAAGVQSATHETSTNCQHGVYVFRWSDVVPVVERPPVHALDSSSIVAHEGKEELFLRSLWDIAVKLGPYDVASCNCHHAALAMFNACARDGAKVSSIPNASLSKGARLLRGAGINIGASDSTASLVVAR